MKAMSYVFEKCQHIEQKRSKFFLEIAASTENVLTDLLKNPK